MQQYHQVCCRATAANYSTCKWSRGLGFRQRCLVGWEVNLWSLLRQKDPNVWRQTWFAKLQGSSIPGSLPAEPESNAKLERFSVLSGTGEYFPIIISILCGVRRGEMYTFYPTLDHIAGKPKVIWTTTTKKVVILISQRESQWFGS